MTDLITINSIAIRTIRPIPNVLVLNSSTIQYYLFTDQHEEKELSQTNLVQFLDDILHSPHKVVVSSQTSLPPHSFILLFLHDDPLWN